MKNKTTQGGIKAPERNLYQDSYRVELKPSFLVDRLCDQLALERNTIRLYTAIMRKPFPRESFVISSLELEKLRDEKLDHFLLLSNALKAAGEGEDPSQNNFCNEINCLAPRGHLKVLSDRRAPLSQCLSVLLSAEQANWDGWQLLIPLAKITGYEEMTRQFEQALLLEEDHLRKVRLWISQVMVFAEAKAA
jgi:hypothetical protein